MNDEVWPGRPFPMGAMWDGGGTNFALFSEIAEEVELCLIGDDGQETRIGLDEVDGMERHPIILERHVDVVPHVLAWQAGETAVRQPGVVAHHCVVGAPHPVGNQVSVRRRPRAILRFRSRHCGPSACIRYRGCAEETMLRRFR